MDKHEDLLTTARLSKNAEAEHRCQRKFYFMVCERLKSEMTMIGIWLHIIKWKCKSVFQNPQKTGEAS